VKAAQHKRHKIARIGFGGPDTKDPAFEFPQILDGVIDVFFDPENRLRIFVKDSAFIRKPVDPPLFFKFFLACVNVI